MPLYICNATNTSLNSEAKTKIAQDITDIHCRVTGAPASFVHAVFFENASEETDGESLFVRGTIRAGRSDEQKVEIADAIKASLIQHGSVEQADTQIVETPASWVLEGGEIMPEPGEEAEWFAAQEARRQA